MSRKIILVILVDRPTRRRIYIAMQSYAIQIQENLNRPRDGLQT